MTKSTNQQIPSLPPALALGLYGNVHEVIQEDDLRAALAMVARVAIEESFDLHDAFGVLLEEEAAKGPWRELHEQADAAGTSSDYMNMYGLPALALGFALAFRMYGQPHGGGR